MRRQPRWVSLGLLAVLTGLALLTVLAAPARAHDFKPALLALTEQSPGVYDVVWRVPIEAAADSLRPVFPAGSTRVGGGRRAPEADMMVERFQLRGQESLRGQTLQLAGVSPAVTEVLLRLDLAAGQGAREVVTGRLRADQSGRSFAVPATPSRAGVGFTYLRLGVEHILGGLDHLAFVLALVLLATTGGAIVRAVTAFTAAHSVTLGLAALGLAHVPQPPIEATIALSIVFVARELAVRRKHARTAVVPGPSRSPTVLAFGFGLLHGLGFAGALAEVGLPAAEIPLSLLSFNLGVEFGQLAFVLAVLGLRRGLRPLLAGLGRYGPWATRLRRGLLRLPELAIGSLGGFWLIDRIVGFFTL